MSTPTVSVCIPVYNGGTFIAEAIESVLRQSFSDFELVIADNCSTDGTVALIERFTDPRIRLIRNETNLGPQRNWNIVVEAARGSFVKLLCADDLLLPDCLERQVSILSSDPSLALCCGSRIIIDAAGRPHLRRWGTGGLPVGRVGRVPATRAIARSGTNPIGEACAVLFTNEAVRKAGGFSSRLPYTIDIDLWVRLLEHGDLFVDRAPVCAFRVSPGSWSNALIRQQAVHGRAFMRLLREWHPDVVTRADVAKGVARATMLGYLRQLFYFWLRLRAGASRSQT